MGVDVFFAISGYLITAHLLREVERTGRVSLPAFWARRARRLLPAALTTLLACAVLTVVLVPRVHWQQFLTETLASAAYVQNWQLARDAVDYLAAAQLQSPVRHFWSLSAEEQFYVVWPLLVLAGIALGRGRRRAGVAAVLVAATLASFVWAVVQTRTDPAAAYFVTPTRAWEFGAGGLLALAGDTLRVRAAVRSAVSWGGLAAILVAAGAYSSATDFPGVAAALPVLGALAVMAARAPENRWAPTRLLRPPPVQFMGGISYAVYLWHWPLLVFAPFAVGSAGTGVKLGAVALTLGIAWLTTRAIEDPIRTGGWLAARRPARTFAWALGATALLWGVVLEARSQIDGEIRDAEQATAQLLASRPPCFGAAARDRARPCENRRLRGVVAPTPIEAVDETNAPCTEIRRRGVISVCGFGAAPDRARATVALLGDSHAAAWRAALQVVARDQRWRGLSITRTSCPFSQADRRIDEPGRSRCRAWNDALPRWFAGHPEVDTVFVAANTGGAVDRPAGRSLMDAEIAGYRRAWSGLPDSVRRIVVLRDTPKVRSSTLDCIDEAQAGERRAGPACAVPRRTALRRDPAVVAARRDTGRPVSVIDLTDVFCSRRLCLPVIGGALAYKDQEHLTPIFARTLGPLLGRQVVRADLAQAGAQPR